jgi:flagellar biosynthesis/type III secretory pathway chaperone
MTTKATETASLEHFLQPLVHQLLQLNQTLDEEAQALPRFSSDDLQQLLEIIETKSQLSEQINALSTQLFSALQEYFPEDNREQPTLHVLSELSEKLNPASQELAKETLTLAEAIQQKNLKNGMLIQSLNSLNNQALNILKGQPADQASVYTASGTKREQPSTPSTLGKV